MRILIYNDKTGIRGGTETYVNSIIKEMSPRGFQFERLTIDVNEYSSFNTSRFPRFHKLKDGLFYKSDVGKAIELTIERFKPKLIHVNNNAYFTSTILTVAKKKGIPIVQTIHDYRLIPKTDEGILATTIKKARLNTVKKKTTHFIAPSYKFQEVLQAHGIQNSTYIHHYIELDKWQTNQQFTRRPVVLYIGRFEVVKGIFVLLSAWEQIAKQFPDHRLLFIGEGNEEDNLKAAISKSPVSAQIEVIPFQSQPIIKEHLYSSQLIVVPSAYREMFGLIGLEAFACGIPVISTNVAGIPEWCIHEKTGLLVEMNDINSHSEAIVRLLNDPILCKQLTEQAHHFVPEKHNKQAALDKLEVLYRALST